MALKKSYGLACVKFDHGEPKILMIQCAATYAYTSIIMGRFSSVKSRDSLADAIDTLNQLTEDEQRNIYDLFNNTYTHKEAQGNDSHADTHNDGFKIIGSRWKSLDLSKIINDFVRSEYKRVFPEWNAPNALVQRGVTSVKYIGELYKAGITPTTSGYLPWTFPKGRRDENESCLDAAIREFVEETGLAHDRLIIHETPPFVINYSDGPHDYSMNLYLASASMSEPPKKSSRVHWLSPWNLPKTDNATQNIFELVPNLIGRYMNLFRATN